MIKMMDPARETPLDVCNTFLRGFYLSGLPDTSSELNSSGKDFRCRRLSNLGA